jgi:hypothetical protein
MSLPACARLYAILFAGTSQEAKMKIDKEMLINPH